LKGIVQPRTISEEAPVMVETDVNGGPVPGSLSALIVRLARLPSLAAGEAWAIPLRPGDFVGRYEITREIGRGGFGVVYEALDRTLGRAVAVKTVRPGRALTADGGAAWLQDEAEAVASLSHPGIVAVYDVGETDGAPYVVMELLQGETLERRLGRRSPLRCLEALQIARDVAMALVYAHARGVVHRDLKPANVFLCQNGTTKLLDFGLSHVFGHAREPRSGGTPAYLAPERWRGETEDARTDLFSLGVLLYEMLSGKTPYAASEKHSTVVDPGPPPMLAVEVPRRLAALIASALAKEPAARPASAGVFLEELVAVQRRLEARPRHRRQLAALLAGAVAAVLLWYARPPPSPVAAERLGVSVADLSNETGEPDLDGLSGLIVTALEQSRGLQVLTRSRMSDVLRQLGREDAARIDEPLARDIGRRAGSRAVLVGSIRKFERTYSLDLRAVDPAADRYLFALHEQGVGKESIPGIIDRLAARAREQLRGEPEQMRSSTIKVAEAVTPNLEAYQHYFVGVDCLDRPSRYPTHPRGCLEEFHKAVAIDPAFALAWFQISSASWSELVPAAEDRDAAMAEALRHADRVPPKERMLIRAWAAHLAGNDDEALSIYREVTSAFPDDKHALYVAGDLSWHRSDHATAIPYLESVLRLDPTFDFALDHLSFSLAVLGRRDELAEWVRSWSAMAPTPAVLRALVRGKLGLGDAPAAAAIARRALEMNPSEYTLRALGWALAFSGDYATLEAELSSPETRLTPVLRYVLAHARAAQGRRAEALRMLDAMTRNAPDDVVRRDVRLVRAQLFAGDGDAAGVWAEAKALLSVDPARAGLLAPYLAWLGDPVRARELASHLEPGSSNHQLFAAAADWREGRHALARANLEALESRDPLPVEAMIAPAFLRAEVSADEGLDAEAVEALRRFQQLPFQPYWRSWAYPRSLFLLARSLDRLGKREEARAELDRLLRLWVNADHDLPLLKEAHALKAKLDAP
jgi:tetratricopeptide (TPR) repeat protein